ncbi:MAG: SUMF1/EgtB/PvdO family nonheme iron enzyme [Deltaproteobacteria bacterium]|nr:SUMF1/EgtB/PvdO family nonheme iron enzyme [Deltaproteobacteria bacterium]
MGSRKMSAAVIIAGGLLLAGTARAQGAKPLKKCAPDAVVSGTVCMDRYEGSVWRVSNPFGANKGLVKKIQRGKATVADLAKGGATQLGVSSDDYAPCADSGQNCLNDIYAVTLAGVPPSSRLTWFQAQAACENAAKRLPSNAEWQAAVTGTPDPGPDDGVSDCNTGSTLAVALTGSRAGCVSTRGAFDMVGNLSEWVADWGPRTTGCTSWSVTVSPTGDHQCFLGAADTGDPGALVRGGYFEHHTGAGPLTVFSDRPSDSNIATGFRCAR